jgi:hypothetical protein
LTSDVERQASLRLGAGSCPVAVELVVGLGVVRSDEGDGPSAIEDEHTVEISRIAIVSTRRPNDQLVPIRALLAASG